MIYVVLRSMLPSFESAIIAGFHVAGAPAEHRSKPEARPDIISRYFQHAGHIYFTVLRTVTFSLSTTQISHPFLLLLLPHG